MNITSRQPIADALSAAVQPAPGRTTEQCIADAITHVATKLHIPHDYVRHVAEEEPLAAKIHEQRIQWMATWAAKSGVQLELEGECGFGRECVGITSEGKYPDYEWHDAKWNRADPNGKVWTPPDAYHKHPCVAVLGRGLEAETQLYDWLKWFDENGFKLETGDQPMDPALGIVGILLGKNRYARMVRRLATEGEARS
jgi:hypothetical protein